MPKLRSLVAEEQGFNLVEFMVSTLVTLIVLGETVGALSHALRANESVTLLADSNQNLRAGTNFLSRDLLQAGTGIPTGGIPIPSGNGSVPIKRPSPPGLAYTFPTDLGVLPAVTPGAGLGPVVNGRNTDIITLLYADPSLALSQAPLAAIAPDGSNMTVAAGTPINDPSNRILPGDLIMFSNAVGNAIQEVTRTDGQRVFFEATDISRLNQPNAPEGTILLLQSSPGVFPPTTATRITMVTYYIDTTTEAGIPRLVRRVNHNPGRSLAGTMETLDLSYDLVDGVTNPTRVKVPVAPNTPHQIRKVNLHLGVRSDVESSQSDRFLRNQVNTQVSLRSLAFVDRYR